MLNLNSIMIGSTQADVLGDFYGKVFARPADMAEEGGYGWQIGNTFFTILDHSKVNGMAKEPERVMCNFETKELPEEFARIQAVGATVVKEPYEMEGAPGLWIATFADPDGNYFQLMTPWESSGEQ